ncbi:MAG: hypothetical protein JNL74_17495 [Fibrobacteres bacterium]|nr:hypothetical protein [Fibrobacterota bacterium]
MKSSMWIALNINFIPQTIYCLLRFKEPVTAGQSIGMVLGLICILILSEAGNSKSNADSGKLFSKSVLKNLPILLGLLISNSVLGIAIKELSNTPYGNTTMWDVGTIPFYLIFYGSVMLLLIPFALFNNFKREILPKAILPGLIAAAGSTGGMVLVGIIINTGISAASFFPIISVTSILTGSLSAVLFFKEKVTKTLIFGNILAFASILSTVLF